MWAGMRTRNLSADALGVPSTAWTVAESAASLGIDYDACLDLIHAGKLHAFKVGNQYRVPDEALKQYVEAAREAMAGELGAS